MNRVYHKTCTFLQAMSYAGDWLRTVSLIWILVDHYDLSLGACLYWFAIGQVSMTIGSLVSRPKSLTPAAIVAGYNVCLALSTAVLAYLVYKGDQRFWLVCAIDWASMAFLGWSASSWSLFAESVAPPGTSRPWETPFRFYWMLKILLGLACLQAARIMEAPFALHLAISSAAFLPIALFVGMSLLLVDLPDQRVALAQPRANFFKGALAFFRPPHLKYAWASLTGAWTLPLAACGIPVLAKDNHADTMAYLLWFIVAGELVAYLSKSKSRPIQHLLLLDSGSFAGLFLLSIGLLSLCGYASPLWMLIVCYCILRFVKNPLPEAVDSYIKALGEEGANLRCFVMLLRPLIFVTLTLAAHISITRYGLSAGQFVMGSAFAAICLPFVLIALFGGGAEDVTPEHASV